MTDPVGLPPDAGSHHEGDIWWSTDPKGNPVKNTIPPGNGSQTVDQTYTDPATGTVFNSRVVSNGQGGYQRWTDNSDGSATYAGKDTSTGSGYVQAYNKDSSTSGTPDYVIGAQPGNWQDNHVSAYDRHGNLTGVMDNSVDTDGRQNSTYTDATTGAHTMFGDQPDGKGGFVHSALTGQIDSTGQGWRNDTQGNRWHVVPTTVDDQGHQAPMMWRTQTDATGTHAYYMTPLTDAQGNLTGFLGQDDFTGLNPKDSYQTHTNEDGTTTHDSADGTRIITDRDGTVQSTQKPPDTRSNWRKAWDTINHLPGKAVGEWDRFMDGGIQQMGNPVDPSYSWGARHTPDPDLTLTGIGKGLGEGLLAPAIDLYKIADAYSTGVTEGVVGIGNPLLPGNEALMKDGTDRLDHAPVLPFVLDAVTMLPGPEFTAGELLASTMSRLGIYRAGSRTAEEALIDALVAEGRTTPEILARLEQAGALGQAQHLTDDEVTTAIQQARHTHTTNPSGLHTPDPGGEEPGTDKQIPGRTPDNSSRNPGSPLGGLGEGLSTGAESMFDRIAHRIDTFGSGLDRTLQNWLPVPAVAGIERTAIGDTFKQLSAGTKTAGEQFQQMLSAIMTGRGRAQIGPGERFTADNGITYVRDTDGHWYGIENDADRTWHRLPDDVYPLRTGDWRKGRGFTTREPWATLGRKDSEYIPAAQRKSLEEGTSPGDKSVPSIGDDTPNGSGTRYSPLNLSSLSKASDSARSKAKGLIGESLTRTRLEDRGLRIVAEQPYLPIPDEPGKYFRPDFLCVDKDGNIVLVESKYGGGTYEAGQYKAYTRYRNNGNYGVALENNNIELAELLDRKYGVKPGAKVTRVETYRWDGAKPDGPGLAVDDETLFDATENYFPENFGSVVRRPDKGLPGDLEFMDSRLRGYSALLGEAADRAAAVKDPRAPWYKSGHDILQGILDAGEFPADKLQEIMGRGEDLRKFGVEELNKLLHPELGHTGRNAAPIAATTATDIGIPIGALSAIPIAAALRPSPIFTAPITGPLPHPFWSKHARRTDQSLVINVIRRPPTRTTLTTAENARIITYASGIR